VTLVLSPAKLTVSLRVTGVLPNGYHTIDAEMVTLDLCDDLHFEPGDSLSVTLAGAAAHGLAVTLNADNLINKALRLVGRSAAVSVTKRIPAGAGLGGGSGNAAAVLRWARRTAPSDILASASLGADVPFCVLGGRAQVGGVGELLTPLPYTARTFTLICPPFGVSTPAVYKAWDALHADHLPHQGSLESSAVNDLEAAALHVEPRLALWRDRLFATTGVRPQLAGSGSTWFVEGAFPGEDRIVTCTVPAFPTSELAP
jgi:4-diphosphocytidyl-2-C-methyl-D-erythritol kinase